MSLGSMATTTTAAWLQVMWWGNGTPALHHLRGVAQVEAAVEAGAPPLMYNDVLAALNRPRQLVHVEPVKVAAADLSLATS